MGATTATLVGEGADWRFLGGSAGGGLQDTTGIDASFTFPEKKRLSEASQVIFQKAFVSQELFSKMYPPTNANLRILAQLRSCLAIYFFRLLFLKQKQMLF